MKKDSGFVLVFVLLTVLALASMLALLRLWSFAGIKQSKILPLSEEVELSIPALMSHCLQKAQDKTNQQEETEEPSYPLEIECPLAGFEVKAFFYPEKSFLDLNQAPFEVLRDNFEAWGIPSSRADIMAASLLDWIDPDAEHHANGAEAEYYEKFGYQPRNAPLQRLDEVILIKGFDPYLFWISPGIYQKVTIYGGRKDDEEKDHGKFPWNPLRTELNIRYHGQTWHYLAVSNGSKVLYQKLFSLAPLEKRP